MSGDLMMLPQTRSLPTTPEDWMDRPGVVVSGHVGRNVTRVRIDGSAYFVKCEHHVSWERRRRNAFAGFGWVSLARREQMVMARLVRWGVPVPAVVCCGESRNRAVLVLEDVGASYNGSDLRTTPDADTIEAWADVVARIHAAGVDAPDLFAKHFLFRSGHAEPMVIDWQQARLVRRVGVSARVRSVAALFATLPQGVDVERFARQFLCRYRRQTCLSVSIDDAVGHAVRRLSGRPTIQRLRTAPLCAAQELVRIDDERCCVRADHAEEVRRWWSAGRLRSKDPGAFILTREAQGGDVWVLQCGRRSAIHRLSALVRRRPWRSRELRIARLLMHWERAGIAAPKMIAYGQQWRPFGPAESFVLREQSISGPPPTSADSAELHGLIDRLHSVGSAPAGELTGVPFRRDARLGWVIADPNQFQLTKRPSARRRADDHRRLDRFIARLG